jgi:uracil phosphoribosyltransferase
MRAGNAFLKEISQIFPEFSVGQVLIQRQEETADKTPKYYYSKLPDMNGKQILIVDPMIATGGLLNYIP